MRYGRLLSIVVVGGGCSSPAAPAPAPAPAPVPALAPPPAPAPPPSPKPFAPLFERTVGIWTDPPVFAPDGGVVIGPLRFDRDGHLLGFTRFHIGGGAAVTRLIAVLPDGRGLVSADVFEHPPRFAIGALDQPFLEATLRVDASGDVGAAALSPAGDRVAAIEGEDLVVRRVPGLDEERRVRGGASSDALGGLGFAADGDLLRAGEGARLLRDHAGTPPAVLASDVAAAAVSADGGAALVVDSHGGARVIPLDPRTALPALPGAVATDRLVLAIAGHGTRVAIATCDHLRAYALDGARWSLVLDRTLPAPAPRTGERCAWIRGLAFDRDGTRLALSTTTLMVYGEGAPPLTAPAIGYAATPPRGFHAVADPDEDALPDGSAGLPRQIAAYTSDLGVDVQVIAYDAAEVGAVESLDAWAERAARRYDPDTLEDETATRAYLRRWRDPAGRRIVELARFVRDGCDPKDLYLRLVEDGAILYRITVVGAPGARVKDAIDAFFDAPFRAAPPEGRKLAAPVRMGGC